MTNTSSYKIFTDSEIEYSDIDDALQKLNEELKKIKNVNTDSINKKDEVYQHFYNDMKKLDKFQFSSFDSFFDTQSNSNNAIEKSNKINRKILENNDSINSLIEKKISDKETIIKIQKRIEELLKENEELQREDGIIRLEINKKQPELKAKGDLISSTNEKMLESFIDLQTKFTDLIAFKLAVKGGIRLIKKFQREYLFLKFFSSVVLLTGFTILSFFAEPYIDSLVKAEGNKLRLLISVLLAYTITFLIQNKIDKYVIRPFKTKQLKDAKIILNSFASRTNLAS